MYGFVFQIVISLGSMQCCPLLDNKMFWASCCLTSPLLSPVQPTSPPAQPPVHLPTCLTIGPTAHPPARLPICLPSHLLDCQSTCPALPQLAGPPSCSLTQPSVHLPSWTGRGQGGRAKPGWADRAGARQGWAYRAGTGQGRAYSQGVGPVDRR